MASIPILSGTYSDMGGDFRTSYPVNMVPVPKNEGISQGYLRRSDGITRFDVGGYTGNGTDRGAYNWNDTCYRVVGSKLIRVLVNGSIDEIGDVGNDGRRVKFSQSFDRLSISSAGALYYYRIVEGLQQVTDPDLGVVFDHTWIDGYFMTTDGTNLVVTELNDPFAVNPLKYGSSEADPDPVIGLEKFRNEAWAFNRYTIEVFDNVGGIGFPFARIEGAMIDKGIVGTFAKCLVAGTVAFLGSGRDEPCSVYVAGGGSAASIATREVEQRLLAYSQNQLATAILEARLIKKNTLLYIHLPNETMIYDFAASVQLGVPVWFFATSAVQGIGAYRAHGFCWCYDKWLCGDTVDARTGFLDENVFTQYGTVVGWQFDTTIIYNGSKGVQIHSMELVGLPGRAEFGDNPTIFISWSNDGLRWSKERMISGGKAGDFLRRLVTRQCGTFRNWRIVRFRGADTSVTAFARLECELEPLAA